MTLIENIAIMENVNKITPLTLVPRTHLYWQKNLRQGGNEDKLILYWKSCSVTIRQKESFFFLSNTSIHLKLFAISFLHKTYFSCVEVLIFLCMSESPSCNFSLCDSFTFYFPLPFLALVLLNAVSEWLYSLLSPGSMLTSVNPLIFLRIIHVRWNAQYCNTEPCDRIQFLYTLN